MSEIVKTSARVSSALYVAAGEDQFGEHRGLGIVTIDFKVTSVEGSDLFIAELTVNGKGGPARHLHHGQDEWFYIVEGEFLLEVSQERFTLKPGDSALAPREVPHVWAHVGDARGKLLVMLVPAGQMEPFFREATKAYVAPPQDPALFHAYGMELVGPPLPVG